MVHTVSCQLRLYRVQINWNIPSNPKQIPPTQFSPIPTLQIRHVKLEHHCAPIRSLNDSDGAITGAGSRDPSQAYLSHLELVPMAPESKHRNPTYPTIVAIFSCVHNDNNSSQQFQEPFSIISRWELRSTNQSLHSSFGQLAFKRTNGSLVTESTVSTRFDSWVKPADAPSSKSRIL